MLVAARRDSIHPVAPVGVPCRAGVTFLSMPRHPLRFLLVSAPAAMSILLLDRALPYGYTVHMAYVAVILSGLWWPSSRHVVFGAALCTALTGLGGYAKSTGGSMRFALVNRPQTIALLWIAAALVVQQRRVTRRAVELAEIVDASDDAIVSVTPDGVVRSWSAGAVRLLGWTAEEMVGRSRWDLVPPECIDETAAMLARSRRGERPEPFDTVRMTADGRRIDVSVRFSPLMDSSGRVVGTSAILRDIGERRRAEEQMKALRRAEQDLAHAGRVATMAELATSIAHELNQPLAAVVANGDACVRWLDATPPNVEAARESVRHISEDAHRASAVIERVRAILRKSSTDATVVDLNELIRDTVALVQQHASSLGVSLTTRLSSDLPKVVADRVLVQQVVLNLVMNGLDAAGGATHGAPAVTVCSQGVPSGAVSVVVHDTGQGIAADLCERVFEPFYTTKAHGLGLGLSLSRSIVDRMGGRLWASHDPASGGRFEFTLPAAGRDSHGT